MGCGAFHGRLIGHSRCPRRVAENAWTCESRTRGNFTASFGGDGVTAAPTGATHLPHLLCYHLLFDSRPPAVTEEFVVRLNGITRNGTTVRVPEIVR